MSEWLEDVLPNEPSWRSEDTVRLAGVLAEEIDEGAHLAIQSLVLARKVQSTRGITRILALRERLAPFSNAAAVRRLDEYLRVAAA